MEVKIPLVEVTDKHNKPIKGAWVHITDMKNKRLCFAGITNEAGETHA